MSKWNRKVKVQILESPRPPGPDAPEAKLTANPTPHRPHTPTDLPDGFRPLPDHKKGKEWDDSLRIAFDVTRKNQTPPDKATIRIYNLSKDSINFIREGQKIVRLLAGYEEESTALLFQGDVTDVETSKEGGDEVTKIEGGDGFRAYRDSVTLYNKSTERTIVSMISKAAQDMNLPYEIDPQVFEEDINIAGGEYIVDSSINVIADLSLSLGATAFIRNGKLFVKMTKPDPVRMQKAYVVSPDTGMINSPKRTDDGIKVKSLLIPEAHPHQIFRVESKRTGKSGWLLSQQVGHKGDSGYSKEFFTTIEGTFL